MPITLIRNAGIIDIFINQITMAKEDGVRTVVVGGKNEIPQDYCCTVGGQSTDFSTIDTEIKVPIPSYRLQSSPMFSHADPYP